MGPLSDGKLVPVAVSVLVLMLRLVLRLIPALLPMLIPALLLKQLLLTVLLFQMIWPLSVFGLPEIEIAGLSLNLFRQRQVTVQTLLASLLTGMTHSCLIVLTGSPAVTGHCSLWLSRAHPLLNSEITFDEIRSAVLVRNENPIHRISFHDLHGL